MSNRLPNREGSWSIDRAATWHGSDGDRRFAPGAWLGDDRLFTPLGHEPRYDYPLLVWLPDGRPAAHEVRGFDLSRVMKRVSLRNYVAVQPDGASKVMRSTSSHTSSDLEEAVWRSIDRVSSRIAIHPDRIFLVGQGQGGCDAFRIACRHPRAFAGVVSLGGPFPLDEGLFGRLSDVRRLPMLLCCRRTAVAGAATHTDRTLRLFHAAGAALAMRIYPGSSDLSKAVLADVNRWIMDEVAGCHTAVPTLSAP